MRTRLLLLAIVTAALHAQPPIQAACNGQACTFTLSFDDQYAHLTNLTGAAFSGQRQNGNTQTLPNGTHTSNQFAGPMIYRDSKGRVRTERPAYPPLPRPDLPANPNDFVIAEIHDSVAGFEYVLDPVNKVAHRKPFQTESSWKWDPSRITNPQTTCGLPGPQATIETLGTRTVSGVTAYGCKITSSRTFPEGTKIASTREEWFDPASGELLSETNTTNDRSQTSSYANYSNSEPAAPLFQIPDGYQIVDETGPFQVVHQQIGAGVSSGTHGPQLMHQCEERVCEFTFDPGNAPMSFALTGAPYSGHQILTSAAENGKLNTGLPNGRGQYRDASGRIRMDPMGNSDSGPAGQGVRVPPLVEIDDPIAGYRYVLDPTGQTAYRFKTAFRSTAFQPNPNMAQQPGTRTTPMGDTVTIENLGPENIAGISAVGQRKTDTYPPGTYNNNDKTVVIVNEQWVDPKTGVMILSKNDGPRLNTINSMPDYKEGDPDPALFLIPASYKVIDEAGKFSFSVPAVKE